jgi:4-amino-4-deoxy-L-arabinose transferase-like glycosyltransferase
MKALKHLKKNQWFIYIVLILITLLIQFIFIAESNRSLPFQIPIVDAASYHNQAINIANGITPEPRPFWQPPLYIYSLSFIYKHFSSNIIFIRTIQSLFSVITILLTFAIARRFCSQRISIAISLATAIYGPLLFFSSQLLPTSIAVTGNMAVLLCVIKLSENPSWKLSLLTGILLGLTALLVSNILIFIPILIAWLIWNILSSTPRKNWTLTLLALLAGLAITILPVSIRNYTVSKQFVLISANAGINLYIGNNENTAETINIRPGQDWDKLVAEPYRNGAENDVQAAKFFKNKVTTFAIQYPVLFLKGLTIKTMQFFNSREIPRNVDIYTFRPYSTILNITTFQLGSFSFPFGLVAPLALWGILISIKENIRQRIIIYYVIIYSISIILFFPASRYMMPVIPIFLIFAGIGLTALLAKNKNIRQRIPGILFVIFFLLTLNLPIKLPSDNINYNAELHTNLGVGLQTRGAIYNSIAEYKKAISLNPDNADTYHFLGTTYRTMNNHILAIENFEKAIQIRPNHAQALQDLAIERFQQGYTEESIRLLRKSLLANPDNKHAMINLAIGLLKQKQQHEAEIWLKKAGVMNKSGINMQKLNAFRK